MCIKKNKLKEHKQQFKKLIKAYFRRINKNNSSTNKSRIKTKNTAEYPNSYKPNTFFSAFNWRKNIIKINKFIKKIEYFIFFTLYMYIYIFCKLIILIIIITEETVLNL